MASIDFLEYAKGLYSKALLLLEAGKCDDFSVISGSIILVVGMEKLTKSIIYKKDPLMVLYDKITFDHLHKKIKGENFQGYNTISFEEALKRIVVLYPSLKSHHKDIDSIIKQRNILMHNFGYLDIPNLEKSIQVKVADFTEAICTQCLDSDVETILGIDVWSKLRNNRDAYNNADRLELDKRINHLQRLWGQGERLPCEPIEFSLHKDLPKDQGINIPCPVCSGNAVVGFHIKHDDACLEAYQESIDINFDVFSNPPLWCLYTEPVFLNCECGFTLSQYEELKILLGVKYNDICNEVMHQRFYREEIDVVF
jgi:hypothetical protein